MSATRDFIRHYSLYIAVLSLLLLLAVAEPWSSRWLEFDRSLIDAGQWWRLFTASWVHLSTNHLLGNMAGVVLFAYVAGPSLNNRLGFALLVWSVSFVGVGLYVYADYLQRYVGLSGALHGLLLVAPFVSPFYGRRMAWLFLIAIVGKCLWEQSPFYDDMAMLDYIGGRVETNSHLLGAISGIVFLAFIKWKRPEALNESE